jgi:short subunit dehydrogenase-like uncharacterized protein
MPADFLLYGANGFVGREIARMAADRGLKPVLADFNAGQVQALAAELRLPCRVFGFDDPAAVDDALKSVAAVLHCAGPYFITSKPMVEGCLRTGAHYLDLTGDIPDLEALARRDAEAKNRKVMLLPGAGFDVVPTDCLALHLKRRLPSATHLALAWKSRGPVRGLPPGTADTILEAVRRGSGVQVRRHALLESILGTAPRFVVDTTEVQVRRNGQLESVPPGKWRMIDFGDGPVKAIRSTWGDVFTAFYSTGIPNIEDYAPLPKQFAQLLQVLGLVRPLLGFAPVRNFVRSKIPTGSTAEERAKTRTAVWGETRTHVWGEVEDEEGNKAVSRLHGPEAGVIWTALAALAAIERVMAGDALPGFQTPAMAYGADFALECVAVTREDVPTGGT